MTKNAFSRRILLTGAAANVAGLCLSTRLAGAESIKPFSFVVVSDTHLGRGDNTSAEKNWKKAVDEINTLPAEFVIHLGDVVDSSREDQYPIYVATRKALKKPIHEIPGNHDLEDLFTKHVVETVDRAFDFGGVRFILFKNAHRDSHDGFITPEQIKWLESECAEAVEKDLKIILCCHVPIRTNKNPDRGWYVKPDNGQKSFYELHSKFAGAILAIMHGHFHNGVRGWRDHGETVEVLFPSVCYNQNRNLDNLIQDGKTDGFFVSELRPGFVLVELGAGLLKLNYKPLGKEFNGAYEAKWLKS